MKTTRILKWGLPLIALVTGFGAEGAEFYLRAAPITNAWPQNGSVVRWGFARDSAFGARDGAATVPGPPLVVPAGDSTLVIRLDNDLPEPVSIVIPGQAPAAGQAPVRRPDGRVVSLTFETPPGNVVPVEYAWTGLRPGTYLYHSGSHPAVQCPMGLYGALAHDAQAGMAYPDTPYDRDVLLIYDEIDPYINQAVSHSNFGPGKMVSSTADYQPGYYLLNGQNPANGVWDQSATPGERVLFRLVNAGSTLRLPTLHGAHGSVLAEDGFPYLFPHWRYGITLPPRKTMDVLVVCGATPRIAWYDRRAVSNPPRPLDSNRNGMSDEWETRWFGGYTNAAPDADPDNDGFSNLQEYVADTHPLDGRSFVRVAGVTVSGAGQAVAVSPSSESRVYKLFARDNLLYGSGPWYAASDYRPGAPASTVLSDTNAPGARFRAYQVEVDLP